MYSRLVEQQTVCAFCPPILTLEFWYAWQRAVRDLNATELAAMLREVRELLSRQSELPLETSKSPRRDAAAQRGEIIEAGENLLTLLLEGLTTTKLSMTNSLLAEARDAVIASGVKPLDAVVVAVSRRIGDLLAVEPHVISLDRDFAKVPGIHVWGLATD